MLFNIINAKLSKISYWFKLNKLTLDIKKTNIIIFKCRRKIHFHDDCKCKLIDNLKIEQIQKIKFLAVSINWKDDIKTVSNTVSKKIGLFL